jgi:death on curing protein
MMGGSLSELEARLAQLDEQGVDVHAEDTESIELAVEYLVLSAAYYNCRTVADAGGTLGSLPSRDKVEQSIGSAFQTFGGEALYPNDFAKAAAMMHSIIVDHAFVDGNKRTGWWIAARYLDLAGYGFPEEIDIDLAEAYTLGIADGSIRDVEHIADHLRALWS